MITGGDASLRDPPQFLFFNFAQTYFPSALIGLLCGVSVVTADLFVKTQESQQRRSVNFHLCQTAEPVDSPPRRG